MTGPGRFYPVDSEISDYQFVSSAEARATFAEIFARRARGEIIAPLRLTRLLGEQNRWRDPNWRPGSIRSD